MWYIRTKSGLEIVCISMTTTPERGFIRAINVRRLRFIAGFAVPAMGDMLGRRDKVTSEISVREAEIEILTEKITEQDLGATHAKPGCTKKVPPVPSEGVSR